MKRFLLSATLIVLTYIGTNAKERFVYTQISQKEGLTSTVNSICKEKDGDVWIGTPNGLYSFNGYALKNYSEDLLDSRKVLSVSMDPDGNIWVLTDKHVFRQEAETKRFTLVSQTTDPYFCITYDSEGFWIGSLTKIYRYTYSDGILKPMFDNPAKFECRFICMYDDRTLLCCSHSGKFLLDTTDGKFTEAPFGNINSVSSVLVDRHERIWFALYNNGIEVYEKDGTMLKKYNTANSSLSNNLVLCLAEKDSLMIAGTDGGGINIIDLENDEINVLSHISGDSSSLPAHSIKSLFVDNYGNIWIGSIRDGLISVSKSGINSYRETHLGLSNGLSNPTVICLHQDSYDGMIWIGTDGEGINSFNPKTGKFSHFASTFKTKVVSIAELWKEELVISTFSDRLMIFNKATGRTRELPLADESIRTWVSHSGRSINLYNEEDGDLLLFSNTLFRYDKKSRQCKPIESPDGKRSYSNFFILGKSPEGVWMHNNNSIFLLKDDADTLILKGIHNNGLINSGHLTKDGIIWLATMEGLCYFDIKNNSFGHIESNVFSSANSVICDNLSRVWIGTNLGLSAYLTKSEGFTQFDESDGAMPNEFLPKPHLLTAEGDVYLGGVQGLLRIYSDYTTDTSEEPRLKLSDISIDGTRHPNYSGRSITLPRDSKSLDIEVCAMERDIHRQRVYRFSLSDDKIYETSIPMLSLRQRPNPGTYHVTAACTKRNGEWTEPFYLMTLKVPQPWYLSWWFIGGCLALLILIFLTAIYSINRRKSDELKIALQEQEQKVYEEKVKMLINISHELRTPLTLIMAPIKRLLKEMDSDLEEFSVLSRIYRQSVRMKSIIDMVLDLRKMEVGNNHLKIEQQDYNNWISNAVQDIAEEVKASGICIELNLDNSIGLVEFDKQKCDIVLTNILVNAIKHSKSGDRITIRTHMTDNGMVCTSISDQGPGLGKDIDPSKMFTRFYQSASEQYGSGIGLSYSKILVEMHRGSIGVSNNPDNGATFWWEIPLTAVDSSLSASEPHEYLNKLLGHSSEADIQIPVKDDFTTLGMKLMLVDDNQDLLDFLREALCQDFADIITVTGGNAALKEIKENRLPDIIVSDVNMPDGDGYTLCQTLKESDRYSHIPIVLLTARGEEQSQSKSYRLGADAFLGKPFEIETLMELLRNLLRNKSEIRKRYLDNDIAAESDYGSNEERFILQLNKIISEHLSDPGLDQQFICHEMGVSRALLYNKMKAITGAGTKEYIIKIRIEKAKSLVENTSLTIAEISEMTGFASQSYFSTAFKNYTGMTPSQFKQNRKESKKQIS